MKVVPEDLRGNKIFKQVFIQYNQYILFCPTEYSWIIGNVNGIHVLICP